MTVELNGEALVLEQPTTVAELVDTIGPGGDGRGVAVAVDGEVVPRAAWPLTQVRDGQRIEVVGAIQGG